MGPRMVGAAASPFASPQSAAWNPQKAIAEGGQVPAAQPVGQSPGNHAAVVIGLLVLFLVIVAYHRGRLPYFSGSARASGGA